MDADVKGGPHTAIAIADRSSNRADTGGQLLVSQGPASRPHFAQDAVPVFRGGLPKWIDTGAARLGQDSFQLFGRQFGQQHLAKRGLKGRKTRANRNGDSYNLGYGYPRHVNYVRAVKLGQ